MRQLGESEGRSLVDRVPMPAGITSWRCSGLATERETPWPVFERHASRLTK